MSLPLVEVVWFDACLYVTQKTLEEARREQLKRRTTMGYLLEKKTKDGRTIIAGTNDGAEGVDDVLVIPSTWVKSIRYLKEKK